MPNIDSIAPCDLRSLSRVELEAGTFLVVKFVMAEYLQLCPQPEESSMENLDESCLSYSRYIVYLRVIKTEGIDPFIRMMIYDTVLGKLSTPSLCRDIQTKIAMLVIPLQSPVSPTCLPYSNMPVQPRGSALHFHEASRSTYRLLGSGQGALHTSRAQSLSYP